MPPRTPKIENLDQMIIKYPDGCWVWVATVKSGHGYCYVQPNGKRLLAHRWVYACLVGPILAGYELHHTCFNTRCVNPDHLVQILEKDHDKLHFHRRRSK